MTEERRQKRNQKRIQQRKRAASRAKLPPVVGLSKVEFGALFGSPEGYDDYATELIAGARAMGRRCEFPLAPLSGVAFPSRVRGHRGSGGNG